MKKIIFILILFLSCYIIYNLTSDSKIYYLTLGDFLSNGSNYYGVSEGGYSEYVRDYFDKDDALKYYDKTFTNPNYRVTDLIRMIEYNEFKIKNGKEIYLNQLLKKADVITLSVGMNELYYKLNVNDDNIYNYLNQK